MRSMERWLYAAVIAAVLAGGGMARGQCGGWLAGDAVPGVDGDVYAAVEWDPDGEGPEGAKWVVGGTFDSAGWVSARNIAAFDPATGVWSPLSTGMREGWLLTAVYALAVLPNGQLVAGGVFSRAGDVPVSNVAAWNGTTWAPLGAGLNSRVFALTALPNGDLIAGGMFTTAGGQPANRVARWDGSVWSPMGAGFGRAPTTTEAVYSLSVAPNGQPVACSLVGVSRGVPVPMVAVWNGQTWEAPGGGLEAFGRVAVSLPNGDIVAGLRVIPGYLDRIMRWNGATWSVMGNSPTGQALALAVGPGDQLLAGGSFSSRIVRWNGTAWTSLAQSPNGTVRAITRLSDDSVLVGGNFGLVAGLQASRIARWDGTTWTALTAGTSAMRALATSPDGDLIAGGDFTQVKGVAANRIARWNGARWAPLGSGLNGPVHCVIALPGGDIIAGGEFTRAGSATANRIARWNGRDWVPMGSLPLTVTHLLSLPDGRVLAIGTRFEPGVGEFATSLNVWHGQSWTNSISAPRGLTFTLWLGADGSIMAGGRFSNPDGYLGCVAVLTESGWAYSGSELHSGSEVRAAIPRAGGGWWLGGKFALPTTTFYHVATWNGQNVSPVGSPGGTFIQPSKALVLLPNGDLISSSGRSASVPAGQALARWDGTEWTPFEGGANGPVHAIALHNGELIVGGEFARVGDTASASFARYSLTGIPFVASHPESQTITDHDTLTLSATPASGYDGVSVQWRRNGVAIVDGPGGASVGGGTVSGATRVLASPTDGTPAVLTIAGARMSDAGTYTATFTNTCGDVTTLPATVGVDPCPADFDA
ncbi:MAG: hypothetical protein ACOYN0_17860, partial [Phycisphaerales bacterium]